MANKGDGTRFCRDMPEMMIVCMSRRRTGLVLCEGKTIVDLSMNDDTVVIRLIDWLLSVYEI